jgi:hypothetical protein
LRYASVHWLFFQFLWYTCFPLEATQDFPQRSDVGLQSRAVFSFGAVYMFGFDCRHRVNNGCVEVDQGFLRAFWCVLCLQVLSDEVIVSVFIYVFATELCMFGLIDLGVASYVNGRCDHCVIHPHAEGGVIHLGSGNLVCGRGGDKDMVW